MPNLPFPTDLTSFVTWLGSSAGMAFVEATLLEQLPYWEKLSSNAKRAVVFALSMALPILSTWLLGATQPEHLTAVQWYLNLALQGLFVWASSQWMHAVNPARPKVEVSQTVTETTGTSKAGTVEKTVSVVTSDAKVAEPASPPAGPVA